MYACLMPCRKHHVFQRFRPPTPIISFSPRTTAQSPEAFPTCHSRNSPIVTRNHQRDRHVAMGVDPLSLTFIPTPALIQDLLHFLAATGLFPAPIAR